MASPRNSRHHGVQDGVAQELQAFVVQRASLFRAQEDGLVQDGLLVVMDVAGEEAQDSVETKIRLSVPVEQESYFVYLIA